MKGPAFQSDAAKAKLLQVARSWIGTPFRKGASIKGAGVDCVNLAASIYTESGFYVSRSFPGYSLDEGSHSTKSKIETWLKLSADRFEEVVDFGIGDLLVFKMGFVTHHVGVMITNSTFINAMKGYGVVELNIEDRTWARRLQSAHRPIEVYLSPA